MIRILLVPLVPERRVLTRGNLIGGSSTCRGYCDANTFAWVSGKVAMMSVPPIDDAVRRRMADRQHARMRHMQELLPVSAPRIVGWSAAAMHTIFSWKSGIARSDGPRLGNQATRRSTSPLSSISTPALLLGLEDAQAETGLLTAALKDH